MSLNITPRRFFLLNTYTQVKILTRFYKIAGNQIKFFKITFNYASDELLQKEWLMTGHEIFKLHKIRLVKYVEAAICFQ